jgi:hypothetical protein
LQRSEEGSLSRTAFFYILITCRKLKTIIVVNSGAIMKKQEASSTSSRSKRQLASFDVLILHEDFLNELPNSQQFFKPELEELGLYDNSEPYLPILKVQYNPSQIGTVLFNVVLHRLNRGPKYNMDDIVVDDNVDKQLDVAEVFFHINLEEMLTQAITLLIDLALLYSNHQKTLTKPMVQPYMKAFEANTIYSFLPMRSRGGKEKASSHINREELSARVDELRDLWREVKKAYHRNEHRLAKAKSYSGQGLIKATIEATKKEIPQAAKLPGDLLAKLSLTKAQETAPRHLAVEQAKREFGLKLKYRTIERIISKTKKAK